MNPTSIFLSSSKIVVCQSTGKGLGVFALRNITKNELIEIAPVLIIPAFVDYQILEAEIGNYAFEWENNEMAIALGYGSLYNHSYAPNARYELHYNKHIIKIFALKEIGKGNEIKFNYNGDPNDCSPVWFDVLE